MTPTQVLNYLPDEPLGFHYTVEQVSPLVQRVWLHHEYDYDYACGKPVKTVWGFIKAGKVHSAKSHKQANPKSVCPLVDAYKLPGYTAFIPTTTNLTHIK